MLRALSSAFILGSALAAGIDGQHDEQILTVADHHACLIEQTAESDIAGELICWGRNDQAELEAPEVRGRGARFAGPLRVCARADAGTH